MNITIKLTEVIFRSVLVKTKGTLIFLYFIKKIIPFLSKMYPIKIVYFVRKKSTQYNFATFKFVLLSILWIFSVSNKYASLRTYIYVGVSVMLYIHESTVYMNYSILTIKLDELF